MLYSTSHNLHNININSCGVLLAANVSVTTDSLFSLQDGSTPLMFACQNGHLEIVQVLLSIPSCATETRDKVLPFIYMGIYVYSFGVVETASAVMCISKLHYVFCVLMHAPWCVFYTHKN